MFLYHRERCTICHYHSKRHLSLIRPLWFWKKHALTLRILRIIFTHDAKCCNLIGTQNKIKIKAPSILRVGCEPLQHLVRIIQPMELVAVCFSGQGIVCRFRQALVSQPWCLHNKGWNNVMPFFSKQLLCFGGTCLASLLSP